MTDFEQIYKDYFRDVFLYVRRLSGGDERLAEDITSEAFFRALRRIDSFRGDCDIRVWLCQIAKNCYYRKRTVDFLGCPDGSIKFSWGYPLKELRSSAPLFISSWIMVAKSFFTLSLSVFAPAFSTYTVLSPNLKVA